MISVEVKRLFKFYVDHEILGIGRGTKDYIFPLLPETKPKSVQRERVNVKKGNHFAFCPVIDLSQAPEGPQHQGPVDPEKLLAELDRIKANFQGVVMSARRI